MKLYVASSWRNEKFNSILEDLDRAGIGYYNFREGNENFRWKEIDPRWQLWTPYEMIAALHTTLSRKAFEMDYNAMLDCDACLLVHPCGRSAHLEAGWFVGQGKPLYVLVESGDPELMLKLATFVTPDMSEIIEVCAVFESNQLERGEELKAFKCDSISG